MLHLRTPLSLSPQETITYLGIHISPKLSELFLLNFMPLLKTIEDDLNCWMTLPISIIGRIATIKMTILPKINYLFTMIPTQPTTQWFNILDRLTTKFYWKNKKPRMKLTTMQKDKAHGGLDAPNFHHYNLANQLQYLTKWIHPNHYHNTWLDIEQDECKDISITDLPFFSNTIKHHHCFKNTVIATTLTAWWKVNKITNFTMTPGAHTPIWQNPDFLVNKSPITVERKRHHTPAPPLRK